MKQFVAVLLVVLLAGCESSSVAPVAPTVPSATLKRSAPCELAGWTSVDVRDHDAGARLTWDLYIRFHTTCASDDVSVKVYFILPGEPLGQGALDGRRKPIGSADAPAIDDTDFPGSPGTLRQATLRFVVPKNFWSSRPDGWDDRYWVEVRVGGTLIGAFRTVDDGTPD